MVKRDYFAVLQKKSSIMPRLVWAEEPKIGLGFESGPSYDNIQTVSQFLIDGQSSCSTNPVNMICAMVPDIGPAAGTAVTLEDFFGA